MIRKLLMALLVSLVLEGAALAAPELELWDGNMTARPLQLGEYEKLYVYTGPGADYKKAENGISKVKGLIETYGNENGFTLVLYPRDVKVLSHYYNEYGIRDSRIVTVTDYRFGWIKGIRDDRSLTYLRERVRLIEKAKLTNDPMGRKRTIRSYKRGTEMTLLGYVGEWAYVEVDGKVSRRGFVPRSSVSIIRPEKGTFEPMYPFRENGKMGYMNAVGETTIAPTFRVAGPFRNGYGMVTLEDGSEGIIRSDGQYALDPKEGWIIDSGYDGAFYGGRDTGVYLLLRHAKDGSDAEEHGFFDVLSGTVYVGDWMESGWINPDDQVILMTGGDFVERKTGRVVLSIPASEVPKEGLTAMTQGRALIGNEETGYSMLTIGNKRIQPPEGMRWASGSEKIAEGKIPVQETETGKWAFVDLDGKHATRPLNDEVDQYSENKVAVRRGNEWRYLDKWGRTIKVLTGYEEAGRFKNNLAMVKSDGMYKIINTSGDMMCGGFDKCLLDAEHLRIVAEKDGELRLLNRRGKELFMAKAHLPTIEETEYDPEMTVNGFTDGLIPIVDNESGKVGYLDIEGKIVLPCAYDQGSPFYDGVAYVVTGDTAAYIDRSGNVLKEFPLK